MIPTCSPWPYTLPPPWIVFELDNLEENQRAQEQSGDLTWNYLPFFNDPKHSIFMVHRHLYQSNSTSWDDQVVIICKGTGSTSTHIPCITLLVTA